MKNRTSRYLLLLAAIAVLPLSALATSITGTVTNKTTNKPAVGDDVVLLRLQQGMQEESHAKTDSSGQFTLDLPEPGAHLIRVTHDKASYFQAVLPGATTVHVDVYDAAAKVPGVTGEANVMRIETDASGKTLHVVQNFFIKNDSNPPRTQFSDHPFEFYLPDGAQIDGSAALGPGGMPVQSAPVPLGDKGHFTFLFPLRPGETRFQISYTLPYNGSLKFNPHLTLPTDTVAVMLPKSMSFQPGAGSPYTPINDDVNAQTFLARNVSLSQPLAFTLSGVGQMPRDAQPAQDSSNGQSSGDTAGQQPSSTESDTRPGGGLGAPIDTPDPLSKYKWWILGGLALVLAAGAGFLLSRPAASVAVEGEAPKRTAAMSAATPMNEREALLNVLKNQLFLLETERLEGKLVDPEYTEQKTALETVLKRALKQQA
ncbi:MAG: carboxypeptidase regulatory-like domain-containing protein [Acidobacteriaceae bacterium]